MGFQDLLHQAGGQGRFQILQIAFLVTSNMIVFMHTVLENFTAAIPGHRCWVYILDNVTVSDNGTGTFSHEALLRISIPLDSNLKPENCHRFLHPQWQLLHLNGASHNTSELDTEPCVDGWVYDKSIFPSTIVTKWDLVCGSKSLRSVVQFLFMVGTLVGGLVFGHLSDSFSKCTVLASKRGTVKAALGFNAIEDAQCLRKAMKGLRTYKYGIINVRAYHNTAQSQEARTAYKTNVGRDLLHALKSELSGNFEQVILGMMVPTVLGPPPANLMATDKGLLLQVLKSTMEEELQAAQIKPSLSDLFSSRILRKWICLTSFVKFSVTIAIFGLLFNLQHLGNNVFLFQVLFGVVSLAVRGPALLTIKHIGRQGSQMVFMFLLGTSILVIIFVPQEMQTFRVILAILGIGAASASSTCASIHFSELFPTLIRARTSGINLMASSTGAALSPLVMILAMYSAPLPWIIYGVFPILSFFVVFLIPETKNKPLHDTIQEVENERKVSRKAKEKTCIKVTPL
ncbi:PREDICTED: solute carrier family 22 member 10 [Chrysochloris asiatica]|uniref:Solute carrier family 22 member 10 n=1 Tax=Chrysochloris asiatica TaxID=185453 RepID=A0A9B0X470_CHRAS|nr:PREDICTED: solute carrier family 22 member 10 [Chrysochloris asiatica]